MEPGIAGRMVDRIENRGPDDFGVWIDAHAGVALAHRRLSILDLSPAGHQPMVSPCERFVLAYNGEIYNHLDLRAELEAQNGHFDWRGHSDTETLLAALRHWGVEGALQRLNGMFAFALWDAAERTLFLARDRMGLLRTQQRQVSVRLQVEGARGAPGLARRGGSGSPCALHATQLCARAVEHLEAWGSR